eukprot:6191935-Pleurochrysis_carterae.AAC.2
MRCSCLENCSRRRRSAAAAADPSGAEKQALNSAQRARPSSAQIADASLRAQPRRLSASGLSFGHKSLGEATAERMAKVDETRSLAHRRCALHTPTEDKLRSWSRAAPWK